MCGRFAMALDPERLRRFYGLAETPRVQPRYNITPASPVGVVRPRGPHDPRRVWRELLWGLVPFWAREPRLGRMINARAETVASKPAFRAAFRYRRCVLPASGFYEWRRPPGGGPKQPYYFTAANDEPLSMAGLWERWQGEDGSELETCTIITVAATEPVAAIHDRMPLLLPRARLGAWLDPHRTRPSELTTLLRPTDAPPLRCWAVDPRVNRPSNDGPELIEPVDGSSAGDCGQAPDRVDSSPGRARTRTSKGREP